MNNVRNLRKERHWTLCFVARSVGISTRTLQHIEKETHIPNLKTAYRLAKLFGKPMHEVFCLDFSIDEVVNQ